MENNRKVMALSFLEFITGINYPETTTSFGNIQFLNNSNGDVLLDIDFYLSASGDLSADVDGKEYLIGDAEGGDNFISYDQEEEFISACYKKYLKPFRKLEEQRKSIRDF